MSDTGSQNINKAYHPQLVILVVEDHVMFCKDMRHALPQHKIVFARTIEEAKAKYNDSMPDITFLDIDLPDGSGLEFLDYIRAREPEAFVIMLTGSKLQDDVAMAQRKGVHGYIIKPFTKSRIEQTIEKYLGFREQRIHSLIFETEKRRTQAHHRDEATPPS